jgi:hypothetical protein
MGVLQQVVVGQIDGRGQDAERKVAYELPKGLLVALDVHCAEVHGDL